MDKTYSTSLFFSFENLDTEYSRFSRERKRITSGGKAKGFLLLLMN